MVIEKINKIGKFNLAFIAFQVLLFITIISLSAFANIFESNSNVISTNFVNLMVKVSKFNIFQIFLYCFVNNVVVLFLLFWISYWTYGIISMFQGIFLSMVFGKILKLVAFYPNKYFILFSILFIFFEFTAFLMTIVFSMYLRFWKSENKDMHRECTLKCMLLKTIILFIAAIFESLVIFNI